MRTGADITQVFERNQEATVYVGNLDSKVDEEILWELFVQCGVVRNVHIPRDKITGAHSNYGFVEFQEETDADYAMKVLNMVKLYGKPVKCNKASQDKRTQEVGANLFVGGLDPEVDEKILHDTFSAFGNILSTKVMRDPETGESKGYGFVSFDSFESSDQTLGAMNGQFLCNRPIHVSYAHKKDTKGERHGSVAERFIASQKPKEVNPQPLAPTGLPFSATLRTHVPQPPAPALPPIPQQPVVPPPPPSLPGLKMPLPAGVPLPPGMPLPPALGRMGLNLQVQPPLLGIPQGWRPPPPSM